MPMSTAVPVTELTLMRYSSVPHLRPAGAPAVRLHIAWLHTRVALCTPHRYVEGMLEKRDPHRPGHIAHAKAALESVGFLSDQLR